ncbi:LamB/YcsF family protein [Jidongwangia harbinensis]|uniref:LamB/YcsF family protein n=1 Tax=Jidongwangia harbinensis TaxID=2878561 RepID=UPI001CD9FF4B|nr:5-oxoprolinase subunit PxpA [Jidongwangia harbinensis]MCA2215383.1 LamB/YcsF family protein [Jidongwangia harbinensis]
MDLNSDLGEGFGTWRLGDDEAMLDVVSSANVACGFHAGDPRALLATCRHAVDRGVAIGAQVSYRDLPGFGRRFIDYDPPDLVADVLYQLAALDGLARVAGDRVRYLKPHGALYNALAHHEPQADAVIEAVRQYDAALPVLHLPGSVFTTRAAAAGLTTLSEAFADRAYRPDGTLVSRREPGAVLHDPAEVADRMARLVTGGGLTAVDGSVLAVRADSICVHGDTLGAVSMARAVRAALTAAGARITAFAADPKEDR